jgi:hypothetical protein
MIVTIGPIATLRDCRRQWQDSEGAWIVGSPLGWTEGAHTWVLTYDGARELGTLRSYGRRVEVLFQVRPNEFVFKRWSDTERNLDRKEWEHG